MLRTPWTARLLALALLTVATAALTGSALAAPPANDAFVAAAELTGRSIAVAGSNKDATKELGEPDHAGRPGGASVWYRWTAPASGRATISTCGSDFDTLLAAYTGDAVVALEEVASNDDSCGLQSAISFAAAVGTTYRIAVDGLNGATGLFDLRVRLAPPNDDFADAEQLSGDTGSVEGTNAGASSEPGEPFSFSSVWYRWTAPTTGPATFETCGAPYDSTLAVYTGDEVDSLTLVSYSDDACGVASRVAFDATGGVTYSIAVDGYEGDEGEFTLRWNRNPPPPYARSYPSISGTAREGETLTGSEGDWANSPTSFHHAWGRCDARVDDCALIPGATARTYTITSADVGHRLYLQVTAVNAGGSATEWSDVTPVVRSRGPANTSPPQVNGPATVGQILDAVPGAWTGTQPIRYAYQWQACDAAGVTCRDLPAENATILEVRAAHVGSRLRVVVTASNEDGAVAAASEATDVVPAVRTPRGRCVVPRVVGRPLAVARSAIRRAGCAMGAVRRAHSKSVRRGRVIRQTPRAGARLRRGARVNLVLSKGRKR